MPGQHGRRRAGKGCSPLRLFPSFRSSTHARNAYRLEGFKSRVSSPHSCTPTHLPATMSTSSHSGDVVKDYDVEEKGPVAAPHLESGAEVVSAHDGVNRDKGVIGWLWKVAMKLDSYGVEVRGVERVPPTERHHL